MAYTIISDLVTLGLIGVTVLVYACVSLMTALNLMLVPAAIRSAFVSYTIEIPMGLHRTPGMSYAYTRRCRIKID